MGLRLIALLLICSSAFAISNDMRKVLVLVSNAVDQASPPPLSQVNSLIAAAGGGGGSNTIVATGTGLTVTWATNASTVTYTLAVDTNVVLYTGRNDGVPLSETNAFGQMQARWLKAGANMNAVVTNGVIVLSCAAVTNITSSTIIYTSNTVTTTGGTNIYNSTAIVYSNATITLSSVTFNGQGTFSGTTYFTGDTHFTGNVDLPWAVYTSGGAGTTTFSRVLDFTGATLIGVSTSGGSSSNVFWVNGAFVATNNTVEISNTVPGLVTVSASNFAGRTRYLIAANTGIVTNNGSATLAGLTLTNTGSLILSGAGVGLSLTSSRPLWIDGVTGATNQGAFLSDITTPATVVTNGYTSNLFLFGSVTVSNDATLSGTLNAGTVNGVGSGITALNADNIASGTLSSNRLQASGVTAGSYGSASQIPTFTVDARGRVLTVGTATPSNLGAATNAIGTYIVGNTTNAGMVYLQSGAGLKGTVANSNLTLSVNTFSFGLTPGSSLAYGSTNDANLYGIGGVNANFDILAFDDTSPQRARWLIPDSITSRWNGGALTCSVAWWSTSVVGSVVWQAAMIGSTNGGNADLVYQNQTVASNAVAGVTSNLTTTSIVFTPTNCAAGVGWLFELKRLANNASDTMVTNANVITVGVKE